MFIDKSRSFVRLTLFDIHLMLHIKRLQIPESVLELDTFQLSESFSRMHFSTFIKFARRKKATFVLMPYIYIYTFDKFWSHSFNQFQCIIGNPIFRSLKLKLPKKLANFCKSTFQNCFLLSTFVSTKLCLFINKVNCK